MDDLHQSLYSDSRIAAFTALRGLIFDGFETMSQITHLNVKIFGSLGNVGSDEQCRAGR